MNSNKEALIAAAAVALIETIDHNNCGENVHNKVQELRKIIALPSQPEQGPVAESMDAIVGRLIDAWCNDHGKQIPWAITVQITAIVTKQPDEERDRLLRLGDDATGKCEMCARSDTPMPQLIIDLAMLCRRLMRLLRRHYVGDNIGVSLNDASLGLCEKAGQFLRKHGLQGSPLREEYTEAAPDPAKADPEILAALRDARELLALTFPEQMADVCRDGCDECVGEIEDCPGNCPVRTAPPLVDRLSAILAAHQKKGE